jgi:hypothetical protein
MSIRILPEIPYRQYIAAGGSQVFPVPFAFFVNSDLSVWAVPAGTAFAPTNDIVYKLASGSYVVEGAGNEAGGKVTYTATAGDIITIARTMPEERLSLYLPGGLFTADQVNDDMSMEVMFSQQNQLIGSYLSPHYLYSASTVTSDLILQNLPAGYSWRKNSTNTMIEAFLSSSVTPPVNPTNATTLQVTITQAAHGLSAGQIVLMQGGGNFSQARADNAADSEVVGIIASVVDVNNFVLQMGGLITTGLTGLSTGFVYYLSTVPGGYTATRPTLAGQVVKPVFVAIGANSAIWINLLGTVL